MRNWRSLAKLFYVALLLPLSPASVGRAQEDAGRIEGSIRDQAGSALPGVKVTLRGEGSSVLDSTLTSPQGRYLFASLKRGVYGIEAEAEGYQRAFQDQIALNPPQKVSVDLSLAKTNTRVKQTPPSGEGADILSQEAAFSDAPKFKQSAIESSVDPGGYSTPGRTETTNRLLQAAAQLKAESARSGTDAADKSKTAQKKNLAALELNLRQVLRRNPSTFEANHSLGEFYIQQGKLALAIPYMERAQQIQPSHYVNSFDLALAYIGIQDLSKARNQIQQMLQRKETAELHNLLAEVEETAGNYLVAAQEYQRAAHLDPSEKNLFDWGNQLLLHQAYESAAQVLSRALELYPRSAKLLIGLGISHYSRGYYDDAVKVLCRAVDLQPNDPRPYYFVGKMFNVSETLSEDVTRRLAHFVRLYPQNALANYYYALSLWKGKRGEDSQGDLNQIESLLKKAILLDPGMAEGHFQLGVFYSNQQKIAEAIQQYEMAIKLQPDFANAHYRLGQAYQRTGRKAQAQKHLETYQRLHSAGRPEDKQVIFTVNEIPR